MYKAKLIRDYLHLHSVSSDPLPPNARGGDFSSND